MNNRGQMGEYLASFLLPRLDFDNWQIQECFTKHSSSFLLIFLSPPHLPDPIPSLLIYALPVWGVVVRSRGGNSILTNLTQFVERLARGRVQPVKHWPLASGWEMGYGDGFGWGANMDFSFWRYSLWNLIFLMDCSDKAKVQVAKNRVN